MIIGDFNSLEHYHYRTFISFDRYNGIYVDAYRCKTPTSSHPNGPTSKHLLIKHYLTTTGTNTNLRTYSFSISTSLKKRNRKKEQLQRRTLKHTLHSLQDIRMNIRHRRNNTLIILQRSPNSKIQRGPMDIRNDTSSLLDDQCTACVILEKP